MGNACNGGFTRYAPVGSKKNENLLLHTLPASATRDHLKIFLSEDEGKTWLIRVRSAVASRSIANW